MRAWGAFGEASALTKECGKDIMKKAQYAQYPAGVMWKEIAVWSRC